MIFLHPLFVKEIRKRTWKVGKNSICFNQKKLEKFVMDVVTAPGWNNLYLQAAASTTKLVFCFLSQQQNLISVFC